MQSTTTKLYGLRNRLTGKMARLIRDLQTAEGHRTSGIYRLADPNDSEADLLYRVETPEVAAYVKAVNIPTARTSRTYPAWGVLDMDIYDVAEITSVTAYTVTPYMIPGPITVDRIIGQRPINREKAERALKHPLPRKFVGKPLSFCVTPVPEGECFESMKERCSGSFIVVNDAFPQLCVGVTELPAEYVNLFPVGKGVGLILTRTPS